MVAADTQTLFRLGGEPAHVDTPFVASGEHMARPNRNPPAKIIRDGDLVLVDIGAGWSGYAALRAKVPAAKDPLGAPAGLQVRV